MSSETPRAVAEAMLALFELGDVTGSGDGDRFEVAIAGTTIVFGHDSAVHAFERLASAIEARVAFDRATAMLAATGEAGVPLWLVTGPDMLGKWLAWSGTGRPLARELVLTDRTDGAPVVGDLARRARRDLGQVAARVRVRAGQAVAERIELSHEVPAIAILGDRAIIRVARHHLPETVISALYNEPTRNDRRRVSEIVDHPFFASHDFMIADVRNDAGDVVVELETAWRPLVPIPQAAWSAVPCGADPAFPWRATNRQVTELYALAARGQRLVNERN